MRRLSKEEIFALRQQLGLTQEQFAAEVGVSKRQVVRWELGYSTPHPLCNQRMLDIRPIGGNQ